MATMSLAEFNKSSAKVGRFRVKVCLGRVETYEYEKKSTKETITAFKFECVLVGDDPTDYIAAFVKGTKKQVGTSLKELPAMSEPRRIELELIGIESIEDLAKAEIEKLRGIGEPYVELQRIAELTMNAKKPSPKKVHKPLNIGIPDEPIDDMPERS